MIYQNQMLDIARKFIGVREISGNLHNPLVMAMLKLDNDWPEGDEVPWCSAFVNYVTWLSGFERTKSLRARSWLTVGKKIWNWSEAKEGDIVVLKRGVGDQPGADVIDAPGHVGFYSDQESTLVEILGGNQSDSVNLRVYNKDRVLGIRRLQHEPV